MTILFNNTYSKIFQSTFGLACSPLNSVSLLSEDPLQSYFAQIRICCNYLSQWWVEFEFDLTKDCLQLSFLIKCYYIIKDWLNDIKKKLRRIWLFPAKRIEPSESTINSSQTQTQLIIVTDKWNMDVQNYFFCFVFKSFIKFRWHDEKIFTPVTKLEVNGEKDSWPLKFLKSSPERDRLCGCVPGQKTIRSTIFKVALWWNFVQIEVLKWWTQEIGKVIYPKYSKHWSYTVAHTIDCVCRKC